MCYGIFCQNIGSGLTADRPDKAILDARRKAAGCKPNPNRCSVKKGYQAGFSCDEFPFASTTSEGSIKTRINRCVPATENSSKHKSTNCALSNGYI